MFRTLSCFVFTITAPRKEVLLWAMATEEEASAEKEGGRLLTPPLTLTLLVPFLILLPNLHPILGLQGPETWLDIKMW